MILRERLRMQLRAWRYRFKLDRGEIRFVLKHLRRGDVAVDIGAHKGGYTYWMRKAVGSAGRVFSFEPQPQLAAYLQKMTSLLHMSNVTVENMAVSSENKTVTMTVPGSAPDPGGTLEPGLIQGPSRTHTVQAVALDNYFLNPPGPITLLKCDVEGHELDVFRGAEQIITRHQPAILFECEERHHQRYSSREVFNYLEGLGYRGSFFEQTRLKPLLDFDPSIHGSPGNPNYSNNFLFQPSAASAPANHSVSSRSGT